MARHGWSLTGDLGDRLRYGDAIALAADLRSDPSTNVGAHVMGLRWPAPMTWIYDHYRGDSLKGPIVTGEESSKPSDEEIAEANKLLNPIFQ